jgi:hypothetical protein
MERIASCTSSLARCFLRLGRVYVNMLIDGTGNWTHSNDSNSVWLDWSEYILYMFAVARESVHAFMFRARHRKLTMSQQQAASLSRRRQAQLRGSPLQLRPRPLARWQATRPSPPSTDLTRQPIGPTGMVLVSIEPAQKTCPPCTVKRSRLISQQGPSGTCLRPRLRRSPLQQRQALR